MTVVTAVDTDCATVQDRLRYYAQVRPNARACMRLIRGEDEGESYSYSELDRRARALAASLQAANARGERALLLADDGIDGLTGFLGCLYAGVISLPLPAPDPGKAHRFLPRFDSVISDAGAKYIVTTSHVLRQIEAAPWRPPAQALHTILIDAVHLEKADDWRPVEADPDAVAYLQYTSGSTSTPKGVMVSHRNLLSICRYNGRLLDFDSVGAAVCWMPYYHDFGLIEGLLMPLWHGMPIYVMRPLEFVQKPVRWLNAIHKYRATNSSGPNFAFALSVRKISPAQRAELDLSCWRAACCAAEPINSRTIQAFLDSFGRCGFRPSALRPGWGLAEATLVVTCRQRPVVYDLDAAQLEKHRVEFSVAGRQVRTLVGCGSVGHNELGVTVRIVDPETCRPSPPGRVGEIWVAGRLLARGYWNRPTETAETFQARIAGSDEGPFLRTGDLGFLVGDELVFTGRRKDLIIVEGRNHYPHDLERTVEQSHPAVRQGCTIAFSVDIDGDERVVIVAEIGREYRVSDSCEAGDTRQWIHASDVIKAIRQEVSEEHGIGVWEVVLVRPGAVPKTSSGKLQRSACRASFLSGRLDRAA